MEFRRVKRDFAENVETIDPYFKFKLLVEELLEIFTKCEDKCGICVEYIVNLCQHIGDIHDSGHEGDNEDVSKLSDFNYHRGLSSVNKNTLGAESFTEDNSSQNIGTSHEDISVGFISKGAQSCTSPTVKDTKAQSDKSGLKRIRLNRYSCGICGKKFSHKCYLERHSITHTGEKPFECETCGKCFTSKQHLKDHNHKHTGEMPYKCDICDTSFRYSSSLYRHKLQTKCKTNKLNDNNRNVVFKLHKCLKCGKMFRNRYALNAHSQLHNAQCTQYNGKNYRCYCVACGKGFLHNYSLVKHQSTHTGEKQFRCGVCGKHFEYNCLLISHRLSHMREKKFSCNLCGKCYFYNSHLDRHKLTHTGEKQLKCDACGKSFHDLKVFSAHKMGYKCRRKTSHGMNRKHPVRSQHTCLTCGKTFQRIPDLIRHRVVHSRERINCEMCGKGFMHAGYFKRHMEMHNQ